MRFNIIAINTETNPFAKRHFDRNGHNAGEHTTVKGGHEGERFRVRKDERDSIAGFAYWSLVLADRLVQQEMRDFRRAIQQFACNADDTRQSFAARQARPLSSV